MEANLQQVGPGRFIDIINFFKKDVILTVSLVLALASCLIARPRISYIDFKVLVCLFNLMIVVKAFENIKILDKFAVDILNKCTDSRKVSFVIILLSFFTSMLITNDIALISLVPVTLIIGRKSGIDMTTTIILQTLAANIGSSLTPMGNPQNLYIFSHYNLTAGQFLIPVSVFTLLGFVWLYFLNYNNHNIKLNVGLDIVRIKDGTKALVWSVLFLFIILSVFGIINYKAALIITIIVMVVIDKKLFLKVDYSLLLTFVCFFIFIGNVSSINTVKAFISKSLDGAVPTYFSSIILSQFISNVPCSVLLSGFTTHWRELLLGVDIGGMGTIIASLASIISYKLYIKGHMEDGKKYLIKFSVYNFISLVLFTVINYFIIAIFPAI
jgi:Na+/H+ antiporter NhaD and related arsenite permeases